jgi:hypothetical protein
MRSPPDKENRPLVDGRLTRTKGSVRDTTIAQEPVTGEGGAPSRLPLAARQQVRADLETALAIDALATRGEMLAEGWPDQAARDSYIEWLRIHVEGEVRQAWPLEGDRPDWWREQ